MSHNQFNIANLPYVKYGPEILQDKNYQFKIVKDELSIIQEKLIEFKTMLTFKYSVTCQLNLFYQFKSMIVFKTMGIQAQKRFNMEFEELIGLLIEIITMVLLSK